MREQRVRRGRASAGVAEGSSPCICDHSITRRGPRPSVTSWISRPSTERPDALEREAARVSGRERRAAARRARRGAGTGALVATKRRSGQASQSACGEKPGAAPDEQERQRGGAGPSARLASGRGLGAVERLAHAREVLLAQRGAARAAAAGRASRTTPAARASAITRSAAGSSRRHSARRETRRRLDQQLVAAQAPDDRPARSAAGSASPRRAAPSRPSGTEQHRLLVLLRGLDADRLDRRARRRARHLRGVIGQRDEQRARGEARLALELLERAARGGDADRACGSRAR